MPDSKQFRIMLGIVLVGLLLAGCKKEQIVTYDVIYDVDGGVVYSSNVEKTKQKSSAQYISILYADLFKTNIAVDELNDLGRLHSAIGDKQLANELTISGYMNDPQVQVPPVDTMLNDIDQFIEDTYIRFYLREPTEYERFYFKDLIRNDTAITPELIYMAFSLSNEYMFY